jgi:hypothetical protein
VNTGVWLLRTTPLLICEHGCWWGEGVCPPPPRIFGKKEKLKTVEIYQILISKIKIIFKNIYSSILNTKVIHKNVLK